MTIPLFNTLAHFKKLVIAGYTEKQSELMTQTLEKVSPFIRTDLKLPIDTLDFYQKLRAVGFSEEQSKGQTNAFLEVLLEIMENKRFLNMK